MEKVIYQYNTTETVNGLVNLLSLHIEMKLSGISSYEEVKQVGINQVQIAFLESLTTDQQTTVETVINDHKGGISNVDQSNVEKREKIVREFVEISILHPLFETVATTEYLTFIDNEINGWVRSGISDVLINKIQADAADTGGQFFEFLNGVADPTKEEKIFEWLVLSIQTGKVI
tara:strand:- start:361 stop:885 length:525 start_codon:yes stop_codon:yes gene_type:complete